MSAMQTELDRTRKFSRCFSGGGEVAEIDKPVGYFQHGLYFDHAGKLLVDHPYNASKLALLKQLGLNPDEREEVQAEQAAEREPVNPEVQRELEARTDAELAAMGEKLATMLAANGDKPTVPTDRDELIYFIAKHAS